MMEPMDAFSMKKYFAFILLITYALSANSAIYLYCAQNQAKSVSPESAVNSSGMHGCCMPAGADVQCSMGDGCDCAMKKQNPVSNKNETGTPAPTVYKMNVFPAVLQVPIIAVMHSDVQHGTHLESRRISSHSTNQAFPLRI